MKNNALAAGIAAALVFAGGAGATTTEDRLAALEQRLSYLEQRVKAQDQVIEQKDREIAALREATAPSSGGWFQNVQIGGVVEIEAGHTEQSGADSSDITVPTVEIGISSQVNDWVLAEVVALYEDDGTHSGQFNIDAATVTLADPNASWFVRGGQFTLPFGVFQTNMISDPLTLDLGETSDAAIEFGITNGIAASVYAFKGDQSASEIENFGAALGFTHEGEGFGVAVALGYINDIAEADAIVDDGTAMTNRAAAWTASTVVTAGSVTLIAEYVAATEALAAYANDKPSAFNIEAAYGFEAGGLPATFAFGYQGTDNAANTAGGMAESRMLSAFSVEIHEGTTVALEYAREEDYTGAETDTLTGQIAVEF